MLFVAALLSFLPGFFGIPPVDRDEARFAQATKQMVESGNYSDIRFRDEPRYKKPPGIYWLQTAAVTAARIFGVRQALTSIWVYRLPSLIGAIGSGWLTYWAALPLVSRRAAVLAALMMISSVLLGVEARMATTDAALLVTAVATMGGLARAYMSSHGGSPTRWPLAAMFWTALGAAVLIKGPIVPALAALATFALTFRDRSIRWIASLYPIAGLFCFAALTLSWLLFISWRSGGTFTQGWAQDIFPKLVTGVEGHGEPPGYYVALFWVTFWPGCALAGLSVPSVFAARGTPKTAFLLAWLLPAWLLAELSATKLPHYVLPLYPSVAILIAGSIGTPAFSRRPALLNAAVWLAVLPVLAGSLGLMALLAIGRRSDPLSFVLCGSAVVMAILGWRQLSSRTERALLLGVASAMLLSTALYGTIVPRLRAAFPSAAAVELITSRGCAEPKIVTSLTFDEPSLVFLAGTATRAANVAEAVAFLTGGPCRFALIDGKDDARFLGMVRTADLRIDAIGRVEGVNYQYGTPLVLSAYASMPVR